MCTCRKGERIRQFDIFGASIGVTFKGEPTYKTCLGGTVSLMLFILFGGNFIFAVINSIINPEFDTVVNTKYTPYAF